MVLWPAAGEAASYARERAGFSLGLHLDLGEWAYRQDGWVTVYERAKLEDELAVEAQIERQLGEFRRLAESEPTHLDSHHHVHREEPVARMLASVAAELGVPVRDFSPDVRYCGDFFGQGSESESYPEGVGVESLLALIRALPAGTTELGCHPGYADDVETTYGAEREVEVRTLCDPRVRIALADEGIQLRTFESRR